MQSTRPWRRPVSVSSSSNGATGAAAVGLAVAAAPEPPPMCRICWQEADEGDGGTLLSPCRCAGTSRYVHARCLSAWMKAVAERRGLPQAQHCDICRARYRLPPELRLREQPFQYLHRQGRTLLESPAGVAASYYAAGSLVFSVVWSLRGAWRSLMSLHSMVQLAQQQPARALRLMLPDVLLSVASEACLSGQWLLPLQSVSSYLQGLLLHNGAVWAKAHSARVLPPPLLPLGLAACNAAKLAGNAMQYAHMGLLLLFGGLARGFGQGAKMAALTPARAVLWAANAVRLAGSAAAGLLPLPRRQRQQRRRRQVRLQCKREQEEQQCAQQGDQQGTQQGDQQGNQQGTQQVKLWG